MYLYFISLYKSNIFAFMLKNRCFPFFNDENLHLLIIRSCTYSLLQIHSHNNKFKSEIVYHTYHWELRHVSRYKNIQAAKEKYSVA